jgi:hypothetical protein
MSLQTGIASYVITKRLVNTDYIIRPAISTKRNSSLNIKTSTTKYAAWFQDRGVVCPLSADVTLKYTTNSNINGLNLKQILYNVSIHLQRFVSLLSCSFQLFPFRTSMWLHLQRFMCLLPFSFKLYPFCTSMWIHLHRFIFLLSFSFELFPFRTSMFF